MNDDRQAIMRLMILLEMLSINAYSMFEIHS